MGRGRRPRDRHRRRTAAGRSTESASALPPPAHGTGAGVRPAVPAGARHRRTVSRCGIGSRGRTPVRSNQSGLTRMSWERGSPARSDRRRSCCPICGRDTSAPRTRRSQEGRWASTSGRESASVEWPGAASWLMQTRRRHGVRAKEEQPAPPMPGALHPHGRPAACARTGYEPGPGAFSSIGTLLSRRMDFRADLPMSSRTRPDQCRKFGSSPEKPMRQKTVSIIACWGISTNGASFPGQVRIRSMPKRKSSPVNARTGTNRGPDCSPVEPLSRPPFMPRARPRTRRGCGRPC